MLKNTRLQMIAMLAVGGLLGYAAASGRLDVFRRASAEPLQQFLVADKESSAVKTTATACCPEVLTKGQLVAMGDSRATAAAQDAQPAPAKLGSPSATETISGKQIPAPP